MSKAKQQLKSIRLCLSAHPDNEAGSEFADRISDLDELIKAQEDADAALMDDFAKAAMQASMSNEDLRKALILDARQAGVSVDEYIARDAYDIASAMMQERERRIKG